VAIDHGVYSVAGTPTSWRQRVVAACLAGPATASHRSAGILWDFPAMPTEIVEVTAVRHLRRHARNVVWHESFHLTDRDVTEIDGIAVTRPVRTFLDLAVVLDVKSLEEVLNDGMFRNLFSIPEIWRRWERLGPLRHGAGQVRALLDSYSVDERPTESTLEIRFFQLLREAALPMPTKQHWVHAGDFHRRIDLAYPERRLAIELLGGWFHFGEPKEVKNRNRRNKLGILGWRVLEFTWNDLEKKADSVISLLREELGVAA
jgi:very-short-patch-repair endonuclease